MRTEIVETPPAIFNVELTNRCPFRCIMCARTNNMTRPEGVMSFGLFCKVIDDYLAVNPVAARRDGVWLHGFGESLVHPEFDRLMAYAVDLGIPAKLSINPLLLKPEIARRLLAARPALLYVSLDGHDDASFERIRGVPNAFEPSRRRFLDFLTLRRELSPATRIHFSMIDFAHNRESIEKARPAWEAVEGIDVFQAKPFVTWDGNAPDVTALRDAPQGRPDGPVTCGWPWTSLTIAWNGRVLPCCSDFDERLVLGDVATQTLSEIWNGEPMRRLRAEFLSGDVRNPLCAKCDQLRAGPAPAA